MLVCPALKENSLNGQALSLASGLHPAYAIQYFDVEYDLRCCKCLSPNLRGFKDDAVRSPRGCFACASRLAACFSKRLATKKC